MKAVCRVLSVEWLRTQFGFRPGYSLQADHCVLQTFGRKYVTLSLSFLIRETGILVHVGFKEN